MLNNMTVLVKIEWLLALLFRYNKKTEGTIKIKMMRLRVIKQS